MTKRWESGDVVRLKSGGPAMTVKGYNMHKGGFVCQWFVGTDLKEGAFDGGQLVLTEVDDD
ncbi:DUF2158 domain-containing protein [Pantoea stewartii]|uniref:DUF2158 domain-containing protein n=1 Tax=Pantoea stewartii TaxID=66269 RepID=UPI00162A4AB0|nr:DUF2158 domain-containing protein [Pantoea stewartii]MBC0852621.1 DUF2158 domain-containing protein [Pantoea stewartii]